MKKMVLVEVEWVDVYTVSPWKCMDMCEDEQPPLCKSVGWLMARNKEYIRIAGMVSEEDCASRQVIPRGCIKSIKRIK